VLDPPFGGAPEQVPLLARARVPRLVYVSCNPAALARDARSFKDAGYRVMSAVPVDQFLWSPHLESVVVFSM
jgi:23S rRNA (uracil1939-C5)-methyltransferase